MEVTRRVNGNMRPLSNAIVAILTLTARHDFHRHVKFREHRRNSSKGLKTVTCSQFNVGTSLVIEDAVTVTIPATFGVGWFATAASGPAQRIGAVYQTVRNSAPCCVRLGRVIPHMSGGSKRVRRASGRRRARKQHRPQAELRETVARERGAR